MRVSMPLFFQTAHHWIESQLGQTSGLASYFWLLLGGALASLLPCVYPIYPITAALLSRRKSRFTLAHPLAYYFGLAGIYFCFGIIASLTGGAFNQILRLPSTQLIIATLLFLLALATAGFLHFPILQPQAGDSGNEERSKLRHTFIMGAGAGFLSSACVGPIVVSILLAIAEQSQSLSLMMTFSAASKMFVFGAGLGLPFLLIGAFGVRLPRSGAWMLKVQAFFALFILYFALGYALKGFAAYGLEAEGPAILIALSILFLSAFAVQSSEKEKTERTRVALAITGLAVGSTLFFIQLTPKLATSDLEATATSKRALAQADSQIETHGNLKWYLDKDAAYAAAQQSGKPVFVDFHANWCTNCKVFQEQTLSDNELNQALSEVILLKVYDTAPLFESYRDDPRFSELKVGLPFFLITSPQEDLLFKTSDFTKTEEMKLFLGD